ncbi:hypothetical protein SAMN02194393_02249 [Maledivibacter halophilus]|uniref:Uncharacterized protein n=1 Tax=Maledivibacter halophilus TaxID=36842 RepID=A0A1T5KZY4_9FIRM|nr:hypothetical protein SAMN02194393_02249 [Maledivibacter halophilus]
MRIMLYSQVLSKHGIICKEIKIDLIIKKFIFVAEIRKLIFSRNQETYLEQFTYILQACQTARLNFF